MRRVTRGATSFTVTLTDANGEVIAEQLVRRVASAPEWIRESFTFNDYGSATSPSRAQGNFFKGNNEETYLGYNTVNFQPVTCTCRILFFRGIQTLQMRQIWKSMFLMNTTTKALLPGSRQAFVPHPPFDYLKVNGSAPDIKNKFRFLQPTPMTFFRPQYKSIFMRGENQGKYWATTLSYNGDPHRCQVGKSLPNRLLVRRPSL